MKIRNILFGRTPGYWLFYISAAYLVLGMWSLYNGTPSVWVGPLYIFFLSMPLWFPPLGRSMNLNVTWDQEMFNLFGKKNKVPENVVQFPGRAPGASKEPPAPPRPEPEPEEPAKIFYRLGLTDNNRVAFSMGYSEITMNATGCQQMIDQIKFFQSQLEDDDNGGGGPDGGLPLPEEVAQEKAA